MKEYVFDIQVYQGGITPEGKISPGWHSARIYAIAEHYGLANALAAHTQGDPGTLGKPVPDNFFKGKKILEVGCGSAAMGAFAYSMGAHVTVSDARQEHIDVINERLPQLKSLVVDSENTTWPYEEEKYDIIIHVGLLYHLSNPGENLKMISERCDTLILESEVIDSDNPEHLILRSEETDWDKGAWGQAFNGIGSAPSYAFVESHLEEYGMQYTSPPHETLRILSAQEGMDYVWERKNADALPTTDVHRSLSAHYGGHKRAWWFCEKKK